MDGAHTHGHGHGKAAWLAGLAGGFCAGLYLMMQVIEDLLIVIAVCLPVLTIGVIVVIVMTVRREHRPVARISDTRYARAVVVGRRAPHDELPAPAARAAITAADVAARLHAAEVKAEAAVMAMQLLAGCLPGSAALPVPAQYHSVRDEESRGTP